MIGWYDVELKCLDYGLWGVGLRCKCYKDGEWFTNVPFYEGICKCGNFTYINCNKKNYTHAIIIDL